MLIVIARRNQNDEVLRTVSLRPDAKIDGFFHLVVHFVSELRFKGAGNANMRLDVGTKEVMVGTKAKANGKRKRQILSQYGAMCVSADGNWRQGWRGGSVTVHVWRRTYFPSAYPTVQ